MKPLHDQVLVEAILEDQSIGGVLLPDNAKEGGGLIRKGKVLEVGPGEGWQRRSDGMSVFSDWVLAPMPVKVGDVVWFDPYSAGKIEGRQHQYLIPVKRILAVE